MHKVVIIGAGPSGIATAIQLKRFGIDVCIFERKSFGGLIKNANLIENYLGFENGISGVEFVERFKKQFEQYDIPIFYEEVIDIKYENNFKIKTSENIYESEYTVIATGTKPKELDFKSDKIFYEIVDIIDVKYKNIAIIGAGDAAFDYALNLAKNNQVSIFNRSDRVKSIELLTKMANENQNIKYYASHQIKEIKEEKKFLCLEFLNDKAFNFDRCLVAIGREPNDTLIKNCNLKDNPALYIIGDVKNGILRQTSIATGEGLKAATLINENIRANKIKNIG